MSSFVLNAKDLAHFDDYGYVVVRDVISREHVERLQRAIMGAVGADLDTPSTWHKVLPSRNGAVALYHDQSQWDARQSKNVHTAFAQLLSQRALWVSIDKARLQMPIQYGSQWDTPNFIHWDVDLRRPPKDLMLQGVLNLSDSSKDHGGFQCIPGFHRESLRLARAYDFNSWKAAESFSQSDMYVVQASAGDLTIWNSLLPHGSGRNLSGRPRIAQFIRMFPADEDNLELRKIRTRMWRECLPRSPLGTWSNEHSFPAHLTSLGRHLVGIDTWRSTNSRSE